MDKKQLRKLLIQKRDSLGSEHIQNASKEIFDKIMLLDCVKNAKAIMTYVSFGSEVFTHGFIKEAANAGITVATPVCIKGRRMIPAKSCFFPSGFIKNAYGILEIPEAKAEAVPTEDIDVVIVPCVSYAKDGRRLGYGGGYYDRFLPKLKKETVTIGVCFDELLYENIPTDEYDCKVDIVMSQSLSIFTGRRS